MGHSTEESQLRHDNAQEMCEIERLCGTRRESIKGARAQRDAKTYLPLLAEFADAAADCIPHMNADIDQWGPDDILLWNVVRSLSRWSKSPVVSVKGYVGDEDWPLIDLAVEVVYESVPHDDRLLSAYDELRGQR